MRVEIELPTPEAMRAARYVARCIEIYVEGRAVDRDLAEQMMVKGAAMIFSIEGRAGAARILRRFAEHCEAPEEISGTA